MLRITGSIGFNYPRCNYDRKLLMERSDIAVERAKFLRTMNEVRQVYVTNVTISMKCV
jgi:hypothetical protein